MYAYVCVYIYIYIYICIYVLFEHLRPVHMLRVSLLRVLESNFPGDPLSNYTDMRIPTL